MIYAVIFHRVNRDLQPMLGFQNYVLHVNCGPTSWIETFYAKMEAVVPFEFSGISMGWRWKLNEEDDLLEILQEFDWVEDLGICVNYGHVSSSH